MFSPRLRLHTTPVPALNSFDPLTVTQQLFHAHEEIIFPLQVAREAGLPYEVHKPLTDQLLYLQLSDTLGTDGHFGLN